MKIINKLQSSVKQTTFRLSQHSPEILVSMGVLGIITSTVLACKATTKVGSVLEKSKEDINVIHECADDSSLKEKYTEKDSKKDLTIVYLQTGGALVKLYGPALIFGALSIGSIIASNNILRERNVALAAAYATMDKGYKEYRNRVIAKFGDEVDKELKYNIKAKKIEDFIVDEETGKTKKVNKTIKVAEINEHSEYARFFDCRNPHWENDSDYHYMFLRSQQNYWNDKLVVDGRVFLNDIYDSIGFPKTKAGQIVGWVYDTKNPDIDNCIDFGMIDFYLKSETGYNEAILLDFNVDGNVWNTMTNFE